MIKITALLLTLCLVSGCAFTSLQKGDFKAKRISFLYPLKLESLSVTTNGAACLQGYQTDGGKEALERAVEAGVKAGIKAYKVGL